MGLPLIFVKFIDCFPWNKHWQAIQLLGTPKKPSPRQWLWSQVQWHRSRNTSQRHGCHGKGRCTKALRRRLGRKKHGETTLILWPPFFGGFVGSCSSLAGQLLLRMPWDEHASAFHTYDSRLWVNLLDTFQWKTHWAVIIAGEKVRIPPLKGIFDIRGMDWYWFLSLCIYVIPDTGH